MTGSEAVALIERVRLEGPPELSCLPDHPRYTPRQREVVQLAHEGKSYEEIGGALNISVKAVKEHLVNARAVSRGLLRNGARK